MDGLDVLKQVQPVLARIAAAADVVALPGRWLLHAGPPYPKNAEAPAPVRASAALACIYEGWAHDQAGAETLLGSGAVDFVSAQAHRCVVPLAALVSPSTPLLVVEDAGGAVPAVLAPLATTDGPDLRFGTRDPKILVRLAHRDGVEAPLLAAALARPLELLPLARAGMQDGDDLHNRTTAATRALARAVAARLGNMAQTIAADREAFAAALARTPLYFLTPWMAAARLMLSACEGRLPPSLVTRMAGNGQVFGISLAGRPDHWTTVRAEAPRGPRFSAAPQAAQPLGAIGDSAVIDAVGFGGQALSGAPEPQAALRAFLPHAWATIPARILLQRHPAFDGCDAWVGMDARRVLEARSAPIVTLGMLDRSGAAGLLGRGVYRPGLELFERALESVR